jgi:hypothetical protein
MRTPSGLGEVISMASQAALMGLHVSMPGKVTKYDAGRQTVDVQPMFKRVVATDENESPDEPFEYESYPIIPDVPIQWPSSMGGTLSITMPLEVGDPVFLTFCDFDPGQYRSKGEETTPGDLRSHGLSGAVAYPGGLRADANKIAAENVHASKIVIAGGVLLGAGTATESMIKGDAHKVEYDAHLHPTPMGPSGVPSVAMNSLSNKHAIDE